MEYRVEQKYLVSEGQLLFLQKQLEAYMEYDKFHPDGTPYTIRSVYFDDLFDSCLQENEDSTDYREKFRIRIYEKEFSVIHLECKSKVHGFIKKQKEDLSYEECRQYIENAIPLFGIEDGFLKKKLYALATANHLQPVQIVEYERTAFVEKRGNVRITFDRNICGTSQVGTFFDEILPAVPVLPTGMHILEVKYDEFLPDYLRNVLNTIPLRRLSFSKYFYTRKNEMINWE